MNATFALYMAISRLTSKMPENVFLALHTLKIKTQFNWSELFSYLCDTNTRPENYQDKYKIENADKKIRTLEVRLYKDAWIKINTFSIVFKSHAHTFDYLLNKEKEKSGFLPSV